MNRILWTHHDTTTTIITLTRIRYDWWFSWHQNVTLTNIDAAITTNTFIQIESNWFYTATLFFKIKLHVRPPLYNPDSAFHIPLEYLHNNQEGFHHELPFRFLDEL